MDRRVTAILLSVVLAFFVVVPANLGLAQLFQRGFVGPPNTQYVPPPPPPPRGGFLQRLFGPQQIRPPPPPPAARQGRPATNAAPPVATAEVAPKDDSAKRILVVGDFVAGALAWGLDQTFADEPKLAVIDGSNGNSGLVRDDYYDWNKQLPALLNQNKPDIVVFVVGANDRQQMRVGSDRLQPRSDPWEKAYVQRIESLVDTLKVYGRPFFWVTAPPVQASSAADDMSYLNDLYEPRVTAAGGDFIDIWNGFTDENGRFISSGPDVDGQLRALRNSDGINFTQAGRLKLAFYVAREIRLRTGIGTGSVNLLASTSQATQIEIGRDGKKRLVGPVISLNDPLPGASSELAGATEPAGDSRVTSEPVNAPLLATPADTTSPQYLMIVKGDALPTVPGRADDFAWPPGNRSVAGDLGVPPAAAAGAADTAGKQAAN